MSDRMGELAKREQRSYDRSDNINGRAARQGPRPGIGGIAPMHTKANASRFTRHPTRYRGISYRLLSDGTTRQYAVYFRGSYVPVLGGESEAVTKQAELRGKAARGETVILPSKLTFAEVAEQWFGSKHRLRAWTRKGYRDALDRILIPRFGTMRLAAITPEHVAGLIRDLEREGLHAIDPKRKARPLSRSTIENYVLPLSGTIAFAMRRGLVAANPCALLTNDDRPAQRERLQDHVWSDEEIRELIVAAERLAKQPESRYDYSPLIRVALYTGLRLGELLGLQWQDIDLREGVLYVRRQWTRTGEYAAPKTKAGLRRVPLSEDLTKYLAAFKLRSSHSGDTDPVFASRNGKPLSHRNVTRRGFEAAVKLAGIEDVSFHSMRHAFASRMIHRGITSTVLAALMGHESSAITERRYIHLFNKQRTDEFVRAAMMMA
jgi:integrase